MLKPSGRSEAAYRLWTSGDASVRALPSRSFARISASSRAQAAEGIRAGRFPAELDYFACTYCAYRSICPRGEGE